MIRAAAVKFHIHKTGEDVVLCGARHGDVFRQLKALGFEAKEGYTELEQGFIDQDNRFYTREEAYEHAKACGQLCYKVIHACEGGNRQMISEDLW